MGGRGHDGEEPDWSDWGTKAEKLARRGRWKEALACFNKALRLNPCDTVSREAYVGDLLGRANCLRKLGRVRKAARDEEEARRLRPRRSRRKGGA
jgi:tetratricopeptide (TPR) repeat protein